MSYVNGTIMFTDIVGSSKLWKHHAKGMNSAVYAHDKMISKLTKKYNTRHNKTTVVKTMGDSFMIYISGEDAYKVGIELAFQIQYSLNIICILGRFNSNI